MVEELARRDWCNKTWTTKKGAARGGRPFDKCSVYALLTNPIYIGKIKHKTDIYDGEHEPIIDPAVFEKVQTTLQHHGSGRGNYLINKYGALLKGLLHCQACGQGMVHTVREPWVEAISLLHLHQGDQEWPEGLPNKVASRSGDRSGRRRPDSLHRTR